MKVYIKKREKKRGQFQFYMLQFVGAAMEKGMIGRSSFLYSACFRLNSLLLSMKRVVRHMKNTFHKKSTEKPPIYGYNSSGGTFRRVMTALYPYLNNQNKRKAIIITSRGEALFMNAFPFFYNYEIIPMLWDVWPGTWDSLFQDLRFLRCKLVFVTVKFMAEKISHELGIQAYWIPEGIDVTGYHRGEDLCNRPIEVYELGRQKKDYHVILETLYQRGVIKQYYRNLYDEKGKILSLAFPTADLLIENLSKIRIIISFPQVDTHPDKAGNLDTLTQRYWEAMLSRCLIVGRAPKELVDLIGYDPVVNVDWVNPDKQLEKILYNITIYQDLVNRNYEIALKMASWGNRINKISEILKNEQYSF